MLVLIAGRVEGNVRTLLDWRGALALGAAFGVVMGLAPSPLTARAGEAAAVAGASRTFGYTRAPIDDCQEPTPP